MRDLLEKQIIADANQGDTTILASLLEQLSDEVILANLSDDNLKKVKYYYEIHVTGKNGFSTCVISDTYLDDEANEDEIIMLGYQQDKLEGEDCHYIDYIQQISSDEYELHFKF